MLADGTYTHSYICIYIYVYIYVCVYLWYVIEVKGREYVMV